MPPPTIENTMTFSGFRVMREALTCLKEWWPVWRDSDPKPRCDSVITGGGGHSLATA